MKKTINSLYVHIPFCETICDYCDFAKLQYFHFFADQYLASLEKEIVSTVKNIHLKTIYVGGGTPTVLSISQLEKLLDILSNYASEVEEYTFESNPESLDIDKLKLLKKYGVNRLSIGVQSTDDRILKSINRNHTFNDVINAFKLIREVGIENINVDLILGLPNVSESLLNKDLDNILSLSPTHISTYSLSVNPHTVFYLNNINEPSGDFARHLYDIVDEKLKNNGYIHYEVSNFARKGFESKHNYTYWKNEPYYGVGLAASGYIGKLRYKNTTNFQKYLNGENIREEEILSLEDEMKYQILLNLRTIEGIDLKEFKDKYNKDLYALKRKEIDDFIANKLLYIDNNHLIATYEGMMILDQIILALF